MPPLPAVPGHLPPAGDSSPALRWSCRLLLALLLLAPLRHLGPELDGPHVWRQMDTARTIRGFVEGGIDPARPQVSWMGRAGVVVLECPLPQALAAAALRGAGGGEPESSRPVFLLFFVAAVAAFALLARRVVPPDEARVATVLLAASPLSQHYSRALVVDLFVLAGALAATLLAVDALRRGSATLLGVAAVPATLAALVKGPALLPFVPPLLLLALRPESREAWRSRAFRTVALLAVLLPLAAFVAWRVHAGAVNGAAEVGPVPDARRLVGMGGWYFGTPEQRLDPAAWRTLAGRLRHGVAGPAGGLLVAAGLLVLLLRRATPGRGAILAALGGGALYVLVFWNLHRVHDYYQIPLVPATALAAALALAAFRRRVGRLAGERWGTAAAVATLALVVAVDLRWTDRAMYPRPEGALAAGRILDAVLPADALLAAVRDDVDARSPLLLYPARRDGWSVRELFLSPSLLGELRRAGATHLAWVHRGTRRRSMTPLLGGLPSSRWSLPAGSHLELFALDRLDDAGGTR